METDFFPPAVRLLVHYGLQKATGKVLTSPGLTWQSWPKRPSPGFFFFQLPNVLSTVDLCHASVLGPSLRVPPGVGGGGHGSRPGLSPRGRCLAVMPCFLGSVRC